MSGSYPPLKAAILQREHKGAALAGGGFHSPPDEESTGQMWMVGTSLWYKKWCKIWRNFSHVYTDTMWGRKKWWSELCEQRLQCF